MIYPPFLKKDDLVALITPSGKTTIVVVERASNFIKELGYKVVTGDNVLSSFNQFGGTDQERIDDLNKVISSPDIKAVWCTRGGHGTLRICDKVDFTPLKNNPKWLIGFSDITVLHSKLQKEAGLVSVHGPMALNLEKPDIENTGVLNLWNLLKGDIPDYNLPYNSYNRTGSAEGELVGGNLTLLNSLKGSRYDFDPKGKILFLEDLGEKLYHVDRMIQGFKLAGKFEGLKGLVIGQMTEMSDGETPFGRDAHGIIVDAVKEYGFPVISNFNAGHDRQNEPVIMGAKVKIDVTGQSSHFAHIG
ncbi:LD-carboxypeptidase [Marinilabiliaceae bacterium ANBcel2]|nr:LD-carboxypeptidase [Marinilabiliaceae bacterium ANBcel2]